MRGGDGLSARSFLSERTRRFCWKKMVLLAGRRCFYLKGEDFFIRKRRRFFLSEMRRLFYL